MSKCTGGQFCECRDCERAKNGLPPIDDMSVKDDAREVLKKFLGNQFGLAPGIIDRIITALEESGCLRDETKDGLDSTAYNIGRKEGAEEERAKRTPPDEDVVEKEKYFPLNAYCSSCGLPMKVVDWRGGYIGSDTATIEPHAPCTPPAPVPDYDKTVVMSHDTKEHKQRVNRPLSTTTPDEDVVGKVREQASKAWRDHNAAVESGRKPPQGNPAPVPDAKVVEEARTRLHPMFYSHFVDQIISTLSDLFRGQFPVSEEEFEVWLDKNYPMGRDRNVSECKAVAHYNRYIRSQWEERK